MRHIIAARPSPDGGPGGGSSRRSLAGLIAASLAAVLLVFLAAEMSAAGPAKLEVRLEPCVPGPLCVQWVMPAGWGWDRGLRPGSRVLEVLAPHGPGSRAPESVLVPGGDGSRVVQPPFASNLRSRSWPVPLVSVLYALLGSLVLSRRSDLAPARSFWLFSQVVAVTAVVTIASGGPGPAWALALQFVSLALLPWALLRFFASLSPDSPAPIRWATRAAGWTALALVAVYGVAVVLSPVAYEALRSVWALCFLLAIAAAVLALVFARMRARTPDERSTTGILALSAVLAFAPLLVLSVLPLAAGRPALVPADLSALGMAAIPAGFAYAVLRHQVLGIRRLVRRGTIYAVLAAMLVAGVFLALSASVRLFPTVTLDSLAGRWLVAGAVSIGSLLVFTLYPHAKRLADRWLYRDVYDYGEAVRNLARQAHGTVGGRPEDVVERILAQVMALMSIEGYLLATGTGGPDRRVVCGGPAADRLRVSAQRQSPVPQKAVEFLEVEGEPVMALRLGDDAALWLGPKVDGEAFREDDARLGEPLGALVGMLLARSRLTNELRDLNKRLVEAQEEERARLAMEVHDGPLQQAIFLSRTRLPADKVTEMATSLASELRSITTQLRPPVLDDLGLYYAVDWLARNHTQQHGVPVRFDDAGFSDTTRLERGLELALYRGIQECLSNVAKHAQASEVVVELAIVDGMAVATVSDNGVGLQPGRQREAALDGHLGLLTVRERLAQVGGSLEVRGARPHGTTVRLAVPAPSFAPAGVAS